MNTCTSRSDQRCGADVMLLNSGCFCVSLDRAAVRDAFDRELGTPGIAGLVEERCPHVFAANPVFVDQRHIDQMARIVEAVETVVALPAWREKVLADAPEIARHDARGAKSVFFGYDFHIAESGVGLIEINTNAGGAMLNAVLARAQRACCAEVETLLPAPQGGTPEGRIVDMFRREWDLAGSGQPLRTVAIVDEDPEQQYLYAEFLLFRQLFERDGLHAVIAGPEALEWRDGRLWHKATPIDLVYNRLTDFAFEQPSSAALRAAYLAGAVVVTPHPQAHALYADKRNLALLSDPEELLRLGVPAPVREVLLSGIPRTEVVRPDKAERLWQERKHLFFKPHAGYGSRAAYRGDKLTRRVWQEIVEGNYVAQKLVAPGERMSPDAQDMLKFDVRAYAYDGKIQGLTARLYQGQTTNFRTPGGGFAPVYPVPAADSLRAPRHAA